LGYDLNLRIPDEIAAALIAEANKRHVSLEEVATELLSESWAKRAASSNIPNYIGIASQAQASPNRFATTQEVEAYVEGLRAEW
jgi:multidrug efflux pump subunit AcrB